jgi:hypothetical protein
MAAAGSGSEPSGSGAGAAPVPHPAGRRQTTLSSGWLYWDCDLSIIAQIKEKGPGSVEALPACSVRRPHAGGRLHRLCPQPALSRTPESVEEASWGAALGGRHKLAAGRQPSCLAAPGRRCSFVVNVAYTEERILIFAIGSQKQPTMAA